MLLVTSPTTCSATTTPSTAVATLPGLLGRWSVKRESGSVWAISANVPPTVPAYLHIFSGARIVSTFPSRGRRPHLGQTSEQCTDSRSCNYCISQICINTKLNFHIVRCRTAWHHTCSDRDPLKLLYKSKQQRCNKTLQPRHNKGAIKFSCQQIMQQNFWHRSNTIVQFESFLCSFPQFQFHNHAKSAKFLLLKCTYMYCSFFDCLQGRYFLTGFLYLHLE